MRAVSEAKPFTYQSYQAFLEEKKLMGSRCTSCGALFLPPRPLCPKCGMGSMTWTEMRGEGEIEAFTVIYVPPTSMVGKCPYSVGIIKLNEGPALMARMLGGEELHVGDKVRADFQKEGEKTVLLFKSV